MEQRDRQALEDILGVLDRALEFPIPDSQTLENTTYLQDAVIRCLGVLGEATKRLSSEIRDGAGQGPPESARAAGQGHGPEGTNFDYGRFALRLVLLRTCKQLVLPGKADLSELWSLRRRRRAIENNFCLREARSANLS